MPLSFGARSDQVSRSTLVLLRLYVGAFFAQSGLGKLLSGNLGLGYEANLLSSVNDAVQRAADPAAVTAPFQFYAWFLEFGVVPNSSLFTFLVTWGELIVGVSLFFGIAARLGGGLALFLSLNFALMSGQALWLPGFDALLLFVELTLIMTASGRYFGVDYFLNNRWPNAKIW